MKIKNIFFDFDGVIAESVEVKGDAFYSLYETYGLDIAKQVRMHHFAHGGMSRFEKIKYYHQKFLEISLDENEIQTWANKFSELVKSKVVESAEVEGVRDYLEKNYAHIKMYVISGTPTEELKEIIEKKNMQKYFVEVFGSPTKKDVWVKKILSENNLNSHETIFVGDAKEDQKAAKANDISFFLREWPGNKLFFEGEQLPRFNNFFEFEKLMNELE